MTTNNSKLLRRVFAKDIARISKASANRPNAHLEMQLDPKRESYYSTPSVRRMNKADFETGGADDLEGFEQALRDLWSAGDQAEFAAIAGKLARIARAVRQTREQSAELSQFVYVMY